MAAERITNMTMDELKQLIRQEVDQRLKDVQGIDEEIKKPKDARSIKAVLDSIEQHRLKPPPGSKSTTELLREDRDR